VTVRFLADEDLDADITEGLRSREPAIDILDAKKAGLRGTKDPVLLELAAQQERIVVSHDRRTMTRYFQERLAAGKSNPGLFMGALHQNAAFAGRLLFLTCLTAYIAVR
jgi:Domain of unknown function (DUF5615)